MSEPSKIIPTRSYGKGRVFLRGRIYYIAYCHNGHEFWESAKTEDETEALELLKQRIKEKRAEKVPDVKPELILYVIQRGDDGPIKVGISRNLKNRVNHLQNGNAEKLKILHIFTMRDMERALHGELEREARLQGEWFPPDSLSSILRFFSVPTEVEKKRLWKNPRLKKALDRLREHGYTYPQKERGYESQGHVDVASRSLGAFPNPGDSREDFGLGDRGTADGGLSR